MVIETPPYFHPEHAAAAVEAGKHVFAAKPLAVDVPGCLSIAASGKKATAKKLVFLVDFQTRANEAFRETARRIHAGQIGAWSRRGPLPDRRPCRPLSPQDGRGSPAILVPHQGALRRLHRRAEHSRARRGHVVSRCRSALGDGHRRQGRPLAGRHLGPFRRDLPVPQRRPAFVHLFAGDSRSPEEISCTALGSEGVAYGNYSSEVWIHGRHPYEGAKMKDLYTAGAVTNIADFHCAVSAGDCANATVAPSVRSNLTAILGRTAGYKKGRVVTWDEMLRAAERWQPDLSGLKD